ncbi:MAG TPA: photosynthetic protein synthase I [Deltaproteobacteria bacterium]|nr:photosynthetic protein synthase I [Deltaproteobacteria bacterium]HCP48237.1 photosynthetic protein synthase I [Deltaproteobacteria bacterium]
MSDTPVHSQGPGSKSRVAYIVSRPAFWLCWVILAFGGSMTRAMVDASEPPPEYPVLGEVPEFQLIDQSGEAFSSESLHGKVWVASFLFTRCPTVCPTLAGNIFDVQHRTRNMGQSFHIVSFTVDPEYDTPPVLAEFAKTHRASHRVWTFLTGSPSEIQDTVVGGLKISMGSGDGSYEDPSEVFHGTHLVLVDTEMQIRGYYDSEDEEARTDMLSAAGFLANEAAHFPARPSPFNRNRSM